MESYKELRVWQKGIDLVTEVYQVTKKFPQEEIYGLISQIQRAVNSIPANIAEGWGRGATKEYIYHLRIARGSLMELETHLIVSQRLSYLEQTQLIQLQQEITSIGRMLNALIKTLQAKL
ncbi:four helix bundle protein [Cyanothece sp. BG0011]|uniref:four helix bundle protein n=1 Tax=Cyanothece sp. BG0011 TaxID=2082950 RepID=UPI000D1DA333|nr:four helix bundle protein [Cyanothece sp. BG0011]